MRKSIAAAAAFLLVHQTATAATEPAAGYIYTSTLLSETTEGCIANAPGGVFVGVGPQQFTFPPPGKTRSILFVAEDGTAHTVATGFNSLSDCVYDADTEVLYVLDSGLEFTGATTGDTVFAIPSDAVAVTADGHEVLPAGAIPYAFSVDLISGGLLVSNAAGSGAGDVRKVDLAGMTPSVSTFASGFDYTGGIVVDGDRVLVSEALQPNFDSAIYQYSLAGALQSTVSGPTYDHGSNDLEIAADGNVLVTGTNTLVSVDDSAVATPLVTGLDGGTGFPAFGGSVSVNDASGRIDFLASSFSGGDDDKSIHRLVPIDRLLTGGEREADCALEIYGVELVPKSPGRPARSAICVDGAPCDSDRQVNGSCTFPLGLCFDVNDPRLPDCSVDGVSSVELRTAKPENAGAEQLVGDANLALPLFGPTCVYGNGMVVPLRGEPGSYRAGKGRVQVRATTTPPAASDTDVVRLVCEPAL